MQTYAILGSTGNIGRSILHLLLSQFPSHSSIHINAFCRSKSKLLSQFPDLNLESDDRVTIFEGSISDIPTLTACLRGTTAAFLAVAELNNIPGTSIALDTAHSVITALKTLHKDSDAKLPKLIILSSASTEPRFIADTPRILFAILHAALSYVYDDLDRAEAYLRPQAETLGVSLTFIKPSAISHDVRGGHVLSMEEAKTPVSFLDVAAGMIEVADEESGKYDGKSVAVNPVASKVAFPKEAPWILLRGLLYHFFPFLYRWGL